MSLRFLSPQPVSTRLQEVAAALLATQPVPLRHGAEFSGKPTTRVHVGETHVVKLRALGLNAKHAERYGLERAYIEMRLQVHHPEKRWFLLEEDGGFLLGNIAPRLQSLAGVAIRDGGRLQYGLLAALRLYLHVARDWKLRLDEGLSNFGLDSENRLYYLDDDVFTWRGEGPLVSQLAVLLRMPGLLDTRAWRQLGFSLREDLADWLGVDGLRGFALRLEDELLPAEEQQVRRDAWLEGIGILPASLRPVPPRLPRRFAVLADIHANLPALRAVLEDLRHRGLDDAVVLGDIVGYGPHPAECISLLRERGWCVIKGNHDNAVVAQASGYLSPDAEHVIQWTRNRLSDEEKQWLYALPEKVTVDSCLMIHGAPMDPSCFNGYVYEMTYEANLDWMLARNLRFCLHGHSHMRGVYFSARAGRGRDGGDRVELARFDAALLCPGSVGQPRDGSRGARYAILDLDEQCFEQVCVLYDVSRVQQEMQAAGFPARLAERLDLGR